MTETKKDIRISYLQGTCMHPLSTSFDCGEVVMIVILAGQLRLKV